MLMPSSYRVNMTQNIYSFGIRCISVSSPSVAVVSIFTYSVGTTCCHNLLQRITVAYGNKSCLPFPTLIVVM